MKIHNVELLISAVRPAQYPEGDLPEFALAGRSNVGKSSFINKMIGRKSMARISSKPGKTQTLNFYQIRRSFNVCRCTWIWLCKSIENRTCCLGKNDRNVFYHSNMR